MAAPMEGINAATIFGSIIDIPVTCGQIPWLPCASGQSTTTRIESQSRFPGDSWKQSGLLQSAGWSQAKLAAARRYSETDSIRSSAVMIVQGGAVIAQWGDIDKKISSYSVRKSLLSALYGIYAGEGVIHIDQTLEQLGIDDSPDPLTKAERQARVIDLLRARSGANHSVDFETASMTKNRPPRGSHPPGTFWYYNNWDFNVLGTIFEKQTGLKIGQAFYRRIAQPISMQDFQPGDVYYFGGAARSPRLSFSSKSLRRDIARFGLLYLRHGRWKGKQIVPESWVEKNSHASEMVKSNGVDAGGYEYLWWVDYGGVHFPEVAEPGIYSARGSGAHYLVIDPEPRLSRRAPHGQRPAGERCEVSIAEMANRTSVSKDREEFGHLLRLILDARIEKP